MNTMHVVFSVRDCLTFLSGFPSASKISGRHYRLMIVIRNEPAPKVRYATSTTGDDEIQTNYVNTAQICHARLPGAAVVVATAQRHDKSKYVHAKLPLPA